MRSPLSKKLVGLEIVEEDAHKIVIQCLIEPSLLAPEKIIRRLHSITRGHAAGCCKPLLAAIQKLAATVVERDEEVDRLYFLLVRMVRAALTDFQRRNEFTRARSTVSTTGCCPASLSISETTQHPSHKTFQEDKRRIPLPLLRSLEKGGEALNTMYGNSIEAVLSRNLDLASDVGDMYEARFGEN